MSYNPDVINHITSYARLKDLDYEIDHEMYENIYVSTSYMFKDRNRSSITPLKGVIYWQGFTNSDYYELAESIIDRIETHFFININANIPNKSVIRKCGQYPWGQHIPEIKKVIFNECATIVLWEDNTKTVVKAQDGDEFDPEKGLAMAISKKALGNKGNYYNVFDKYLGEYMSDIYVKTATIVEQWEQHMASVFDAIKAQVNKKNRGL